MPWLQKLKLLNSTTLGFWPLYLYTRISLVVNEFTVSNLEQMEQWSAAKCVLLLKAILKKKVWINMRLLPLLWRRSLFSVFSPLSLWTVGPFIKLMLIMFFHMVVWMRRFTCRFHPGSLVWGRIVSANFKSHYVDLNKPHTIGFLNFLMLSWRWHILSSKLIILFLLKSQMFLPHVLVQVGDILITGNDKSINLLKIILR